MTHPLLNPRFEVIAKYPHSPYQIGDIITVFTSSIICKTPNILPYAGTPYYAHHVPVEEFREYPSLFKELNWTQFRKEDELPRYIQSLDERKNEFLPVGTIIPVSRYERVGEFLSEGYWVRIETDWHDQYNRGPLLPNGKIDSFLSPDRCKPATEADYTAYINSKNKEK